MAIEIRVPTLGESVQEASIGAWFKQPGDPVTKDEPLVELETDKVTIEVPAPANGVMGDHLVAEGDSVEVDGLLATLNEGGAASPAPASTPEPAPEKAKSATTEAAIEVRVPVLGESVQEASIGSWFKQPGDQVAKDEALVELETDKVTLEVPAPEAGTLGPHLAAQGDTVGVDGLLTTLLPGGNAASPTPASESKATPESKAAPVTTAAVSAGANGPAVSRIAAESGVDPASLTGSGKAGRVTKGDMLAAVAGGSSKPAPVQAPRPPSAEEDAAREERVRMTKLRQTIARRLKDAQNTAAMLTTFNEVDMTEVMGLRKQYKDLFEKKHGVKLGFMSFFVKACLQALQEIPAVNAEIDGSDIIYKNYYHVGVAVGSPRGLVVPVVRDADRLSLSGIEKTIGEYGLKARDGKLSIAEMQGGTFTISNGGVYGSLMSTPILNAPQSAILGMHKIQERPMVVKGEIKIRPMMYLALSYDHRIVDGKEAVTFLVRVKECLEEPARLTLDL